MDSYTAEERKARAKRYTRHRTAADEDLRVLKLMALSAISDGIPESQVAAECGVDRMTVRKWLGKR